MNDLNEIIIEEYNPEWVVIYAQEAKMIKEILKNRLIDIQHIGSTAIPEIAAKPVIDMMIGLKSLENAPECIELLVKNGYCYIQRHEAIIPDRRFLRKPSEGLRKFHIHMVEYDGRLWREYISFRDYLRENDNIREEYEQLKKELAAKFKADRGSYVDGKDAYVKRIIEQAMKFYY
ncbi:MAG: GrpB family protein [Asgard group archaeon]|nr:GrpB family protein [Asgard group archaeon]